VCMAIDIPPRLYTDPYPDADKGVIDPSADAEFDVFGPSSKLTTLVITSVTGCTLLYRVWSARVVS
jgi:hypothetical protein